VLFSAVLDANVLFPNALRDTLLRLAGMGLYRPPWSDRILAEVRMAVRRARPGVDPVRFDRTLDLMRTHFPDATVADFERLEPAMVAADAKDRHVVAAAVAGRADAIVTFNLRDFPAAGLRPHRIEAIHPDEFLANTYELSPLAAVRAIVEQAADTGRRGYPALTPDRVLDGWSGAVCRGSWRRCERSCELRLC
jgi:predicted nucleic acid-binding protein